MIEEPNQMSDRLVIDLSSACARSTRGASDRTVSTVWEGATAFGGPFFEESPTLEVRWVCPGSLTTSMIDRFFPFLELVESREDIYLVGQPIQGLSVKIRGRAQLDIKVPSESYAVLDVPGRARGHLRSWKKWSFPIPVVPESDVGSVDWVRVEKVRRIGRFSFVDGVLAATSDSMGGGPTTCAVELTELVKEDEPWWTICFEVTGQPRTVRKAIEATAELVLSDPLPGGLELSMVDSKSYAEWLRLSDPSLTRTKRRSLSWAGSRPAGSGRLAAHPGASSLDTGPPRW